MTETLPGPQPALRPLTQDLAQSPGSQLRLGLAWPGLELALGLQDCGGLAAKLRPG